MKKKVAFTGTRHGMTPAQKKLFREVLGDVQATELIHGDCVGADADAHEIAASLKILIKKRPCTLKKQRAFMKEGVVVAPPEAPLERNRKIVNDGDVLVAVPGNKFEELRSETWATIRYAKSINKPVVILWPGGKKTTHKQV